MATPSNPALEYGAPPPARTRPRGRWFAVAAVLILVGAALAVTSIVLTVQAFTKIEADVPADGTVSTVDVDPGTDYLVWRHPADAVNCTITNEDGSDVETAGLGATSYTRNTWEGLSTFHPTGDTVDITCADGGPIQVGEKPHVESVIGGGVLVGIVLPILLAVVGFVMLLVLGILFATGAKRERTVT